MSRNVAAIRRLLADAKCDGFHMLEAGAVYPLADWLVANGVLAVDALTDGDLAAFDLTNRPGSESDRVRAALRRCATGEPHE
jgi:hypothetical protein